MGELNTLFGAIIGAALAGLFGLWAGKRLHDHQTKDARKGIVGALIGEVGVLSELAAIDASLDHITHVEEIMRVTNRLLAGAQVFDSIAGQLGLLPDPLPSQIVRFYGRLKANALSMQDAGSDPSFFATINGEPKNPHLRDLYEKARGTIQLEADILLEDLRACQK